MLFFSRRSKVAPIFRAILRDVCNYKILIFRNDKGGFNMGISRQRHVFRPYWDLVSVPYLSFEFMTSSQERQLSKLTSSSVATCLAHSKLIIWPGQIVIRRAVFRDTKLTPVCLKPCKTSLYHSPVSSRFAAKGLLIWRVVPWPRVWSTQNSSFDPAKCSLSPISPKYTTTLKKLNRT